MSVLQDYHSSQVFVFLDETEKEESAYNSIVNASKLRVKIKFSRGFIHI